LGSQRGDDAAGWRVVERLRELLGPCDDVRLLFAATPAELLQLDQGCTRLIVIDACQGLAAAGQTLRRRWPMAEIVPTRSGAGHNISLGQALELAASLGQLPAACEIWCVEGSRFTLTQPLSAEVATACERVAQQILAELSPG
jgi:hydrogenase maturation protease